MSEIESQIASDWLEAHPESLCVCVPARNEAERLPAFFDAVAAQDWPETICVSVVVNNSSDESLQKIAAARARHAERLDIQLAVVDFPVEFAHAGSARRLAMTEGLRCLSSHDSGVLVSTDADARPPVDWLRNIAAAFARGADLVGGRILIDEELEPLPAPVSRLRRAWDRYWARVRSIEDAIDPLDWDPAPRHGDHTGASLAIRADIYLACGGVPLVPTGEDRALVREALAIGAKLVHPDNVSVRVSPRTCGRAEGGMALAMRGLHQASEMSDLPMAPSYGQWEARAMWRRNMRSWPDGHVQIARRESALPPMAHDMRLEEE